MEDYSTDLVVCDGDNTLQYQLSIPHHRSSSSAIIGVLPANTSILFVDANRVRHMRDTSLIVRQVPAEIVNTAQAITAQLQVICHDASSGVTQVECTLPQKWLTGTGES